MADRRDWIKFVFEDFCGDDNLQSCPLDTQGFYVHLMRVLNHSNPPGYLVRNGGPMPLETLVKLLPFRRVTVSKHLDTLKHNHVLKQDGAGCWYSKRMYEDWLEYEENRKNGLKGAAARGYSKGQKPPLKPPLQADREQEQEQEREGEGATPTPALRSFIDHWCQTIGPLVLDPQMSIDLGDLYRDFDRELPEGAKPAVEILCAEIDELAKRPPKNRTVKYFAGLLWGKLNE